MLILDMFDIIIQSFKFVHINGACCGFKHIQSNCANIYFFSPCKNVL